MSLYVCTDIPSLNCSGWFWREWRENSYTLQTRFVSYRKDERRRRRWKERTHENRRIHKQVPVRSRYTRKQGSPYIRCTVTTTRPKSNMRVRTICGKSLWSLEDKHLTDIYIRSVQERRQMLGGVLLYWKDIHVYIWIEWSRQKNGRW